MAQSISIDDYRKMQHRQSAGQKRATKHQFDPPKIPEWLVTEIMSHNEIKLALATKRKPSSIHQSALYALYLNPNLYYRNYEHYLQVAYFAKLESKYPDAYEATIANPLGGYRPNSTGVEMKEEGQKPGFPDVTIYIANGGYFGCHIEVKTLEGRVSSEQKEWQDRLNKRGYLSLVAKGFDELWRLTEEYLALEPTQVVV